MLVENDRQPLCSGESQKAVDNTLGVEICSNLAPTSSTSCNQSQINSPPSNQNKCCIFQLTTQHLGSKWDKQLEDTFCSHSCRSIFITVVVTCLLIMLYFISFPIPKLSNQITLLILFSIRIGHSFVLIFHYLYLVWWRYALKNKGFLSFPHQIGEFCRAAFYIQWISSLFLGLYILLLASKDMCVDLRQPYVFGLSKLSLLRLYLGVEVALMVGALLLLTAKVAIYFHHHPYPDMLEEMLLEKQWTLNEGDEHVQSCAPPPHFLVPTLSLVDRPSSPPPRAGDGGVSETRGVSAEGLPCLEPSQCSKSVERPRSSVPLFQSVELDHDYWREGLASTVGYLRSRNRTLSQQLSDAVERARLAEEQLKALTPSVVS